MSEMSRSVRSIRWNILLMGGGLILIMGVVLNVYAVMTSFTSSSVAAETQAMLTAKEQSKTIQNQIEGAMRAARGLADTFRTIKTDHIAMSRDQANAILKQVLLDNPNFLGTYTLWEPNEFDGKDSEYIGAEGHDQTGRFIPYFTRDESGNISLSALTGYEEEGAGDYYLIPKKTKTEIIMDPFFYNIGGVDVLLTSLVVPIVVDDHFYGMAGIDIKLTSLQEMVDAIKIYDGQATSVIFSNNGTLAGVSGLPELVGSPLSKFIENPDKLKETLSYIQGSQEKSYYADNQLTVFVPVTVGKTTTPWSFSINIPKIKILENANASMWRMIGLSALIQVIALFVFWLIAGRISGPIYTISEGAHRLAIGDAEMSGMDLSAIQRINARKDELGLVGNSFTDIINYLKEAADTAQKIASGDLTVQFEAKSEADTLGKSLVQMTRSLHQTVAQVAENANKLSDASEQLSSAANQSSEVTTQIASTIQQVTKGITQQSDSVSRTASSVEQLSRAINGVARGAQEQSKAILQASDLTAQLSSVIEEVSSQAKDQATGAVEAVRAAEESAHTVQDTAHGMETIREKVNQTSEIISEMGQRSSQIGAIIELIDDIASQTNLLALNAAIEAARAGEHGKGFAVVADEVRKLAERSASAAKEIDTLIKTIQRNVTSAVQAMEESAQEVAKGVELANQSRDSLTGILSSAENSKRIGENISLAAGKMSALANKMVSSMDTISSIVEENSAAAEQMAANSDEVTQAIETIASVSEENSAATEEVSASSEEMSAQVEEMTASAQSLADMAELLKDLVNQFKLENGSSKMILR